ncbi:conserved hypothetical protein [Xenorhabdus bovienii str. feltiae Florida]|nr:conserved hypothetical protein [Xenorhabdus bovienii str. feltiae Florida]
MSSLRLAYYDLSPELLQGFRTIKQELEESPLGLGCVP